MDKFYIEIHKNETRLYETTGRVFFIVKEQEGKYYTAQVNQYDPIVDELKDWVIKIQKENAGTFPLKSFSYHEIIEPMFKAYTREKKLNDLGI
jgi:CTP synthase (UTP-ammonia lyase)